jgi:hypothetical protein
VHEHFGAALVYDAVVGMTHHEDADLGATRVSGPRPTFFFAPDQIRKRRTDWGPGGVEEHFGAAWRRFAPVVDAWVDIVISRGPEELQSVWLEVLAGASPPRAGNVIQL